MPVPDAYLTPAWTNQLYANVESASGTAGSSLYCPTANILSNFNYQTFDIAFPPTLATSTLVSGTLYLAKVVLSNPIRLTNVYTWLATNTTSTYIYTGLYNTAGNVVSSSANLTASGTAALIGAQSSATQVGPGLYYAAFAAVFSGGVTVENTVLATQSGFNVANTTIPTAGAPFTNSSARFMAQAGAVTTALPSITFANLVSTTFALWFGLS